MKTVGDILRSRRNELGLSIREVASQIKAKEYQVQAIEENNFAVFGSEVFALGFVQDFAQVLGLAPEEVVPFFRRADKGIKKHELKPKNQYLVSEKIEQAEKNFSKIFLTIGVLTILTLFIIFLVFEYRQNMVRPFLAVSSPNRDIQTTSVSFKIEGKSDFENKVFINDEEVTLGKNGQFSKKINLEPGLNKFIIKAVNNSQKETVIERIVLKK